MTEHDLAAPGRELLAVAAGCARTRILLKSYRSELDLVMVKSPPICKGSSSSSFDSGKISPPTILNNNASSCDPQTIGLCLI